MFKLKQYLNNRKKNRMIKKEQDAKRALTEEMFYDLYTNRRRIYKLNFIRGILFGAGSALGGTVVIAIIVWVLSLFVNVPLVGDLFKNAQTSIEQTTEEASSKARD